MDVQQPTLTVEADDGDMVHVTWGRSGKRAIVSITDPSWAETRQCTLTPHAAAELARFLAAGPETR